MQTSISPLKDHVSISINQLIVGQDGQQNLDPDNGFEYQNIEFRIGFML